MKKNKKGKIKKYTNWKRLGCKSMKTNDIN